MPCILEVSCSDGILAPSKSYTVGLELIHSNMEVLAEEADLSSFGMIMSDRTWILLVYL